MAHRGPVPEPWACSAAGPRPCAPRRAPPAPVRGAARARSRIGARSFWEPKSEIPGSGSDGAWADGGATVTPTWAHCAGRKCGPLACARARGSAHQQGLSAPSPRHPAHAALVEACSLRRRQSAVKRRSTPRVLPELAVPPRLCAGTSPASRGAKGKEERKREGERGRGREKGKRLGRQQGGQGHKLRAWLLRTRAAALWCTTGVSCGWAATSPRGYCT